jgi:hypothetical protein
VTTQALLLVAAIAVLVACNTAGVLEETKINHSEHGIRERLPPLPELTEQSETETDLGGVIPASLTDAIFQIKSEFEAAGFTEEHHQKTDSFEATVWAKEGTRILVSAARIPGSENRTSVVFRLIFLDGSNTFPVIGESH